MQGLQVSGKTTRAEELVKQYGNAVRVNRDILRTMLHFDVWNYNKENITRDVSRKMVMYLLQQGSAGVVIVDDTNLDVKVVAAWKDLARDCNAEFELWRLDTPIDECIRRDALREKRVGRTVIVGTACQHGLYPFPPQGVIICDIDGTLANCRHRLHWLRQEPKNWTRFFEEMIHDTPRDEILENVLAYQETGHPIFLVSGRPDNYRPQTETWLRHFCGGLEYQALFMRRAGDHRPDTIIKEEILKRYFPDLSCIKYVVDDRPSVLRMWANHGLQTIDVGNGEDF